MSNKRITDLTELTNPTTDDVFPVVDIATNTTTKVQLGNLPVPSSVTTALATKQNTLVSGTNIKTVNSNSLLGSGDIAVQETLVSGTNIKTLNNTSLLGSGNITLTANPSGVAGAIQFSDGSAFASDAANLFWDDTNNRLGVGTNAPTTALDISAPLTSILYLRNGGTNFITTRTSGIGESDIGLRIWNNANNTTLDLYGSGSYDSAKHRFCVGGGSFERLLIGATTAARITGSGSTSATTSLLVQNSAGTAALTVRDDGIALIPRIDSFGYSSSFRRVALNNSTSTVFSYISSTSVGNILLLNNAESDFNRLQFGGTTSSFPSIKRNGTGIDFRLADDSGYAPIDASLYKVGGTNGFTGTGSYTNFTIVGGIITNAS